MKLGLKWTRKHIDQVSPALFPGIDAGGEFRFPVATEEMSSRNRDLLLAILHVPHAEVLASGLRAVFQNGPLNMADPPVVEALDAALGRVVKIDRPDVVRDLVDRGANLHVDDDLPLRQAVTARQVEVVKVLLEKGADVHANADQPLRDAASSGQSEVVKLLLENGADVHANADQPLRDAASSGHSEVVKLLLENGADVHANADQAIKAAAMMGQAATFRALLARGADASAVSWDLAEARTWRGTLLRGRLLILKSWGEGTENPGATQTQTAVARACLQRAALLANVQDVEAVLAAVDAMQLDKRAIAKGALPPAKTASMLPDADVKERGLIVLELLQKTIASQAP